MIEEFSFGNFRSFKDIQTLNMTGAKIKSHNLKLDNDNLIKVSDKLSLLKSKAIYGANASGKSNIVKALAVFIGILATSFKDAEALNIIEPFLLSSETENEPTFFQLVFRYENVKYRYGFEATDKEIKSEWLYATLNLREQTLFIRENQKIIEINSTHYNEGAIIIDFFEAYTEESDKNEIFRPNSLFLSSVAALGYGKLSKSIIRYTSSIILINGLGQNYLYKLAGDSLINPKLKKFIMDFLKNADIGIEDLDKIEKLQNTSQSNSNHQNIDSDDGSKKRNIIISKRNKFNANLEKEGFGTFHFDFQESEGTNKMFELGPPIYHSINNGIPLIIDEFDARFHPLITKKIVELFNSPLNKNAQLIFVTHDTNLLSADLLRRDQIDFVEKDKYGASHLYTLVKFKGIRNNASFEKDYIQGKYGAIPFLGNFDTLFKTELDA